MVKHLIDTTWGSSPEERARPFPCDSLLSQPDAAYFRGITISATAPTVFSWLCQLRVAPYSYDWLDNGGRRSPQHIIAGLTDLTIGDRFMTIFTLTDFQPDAHITLSLTAPRAVAMFGRLAITYAIFPQTEAHCRLVAKLLITYPRTFWGTLMHSVLPWGDLIMMRRQFLNIRTLAERVPPIQDKLVQGEINLV